MTVDKDGSLEYGDGTDKKTIPTNKLLEELVSTLDKRVEFGEVAKGEEYNANEFAEIDKSIEEFNKGR